MRARKDNNESARPTRNDRIQAVAVIEELVESGVLRDEREIIDLREKVAQAYTRKDLRQVLESAQPGRRRPNDLRVSDAERQTTLRHLDLYQRDGYLSEEEATCRKKAVLEAKTPIELKAQYDQLPPVSSLSSGERRIGSRERSKAMDQLQQVFDENRIDFHEYERARSQIDAARTKPELKSALAGYVNPAETIRSAGQKIEAAANTGQRIAIEGAHRMRAFAVRAAGALGLLIVAVIAALLGESAVAVTAIIGGVVLGILAARALFRRR